MHQHDVYFWLHENVSNNDKEQFRASLQTLLGISTVERGFIGTPIVSERAVVDASFSFSLHLTFTSTATHDQYQVDPLHTAFVAENNAKWTRVQVYDSEIS